MSISVKTIGLLLWKKLNLQYTPANWGDFVFFPFYGQTVSVSYFNSGVCVIIKLKRKQCSANTSHVDLKTTHFTNIARVGRWMVKIWSFSFLSLKLKIKQFRELGMTCEWMRWHWNYEVKSLSFRVAMSVLSILPHFEHWEFINPPFLWDLHSRLDSEYLRKDVL